MRAGEEGVRETLLQKLPSFLILALIPVQNLYLSGLGVFRTILILIITCSLTLVPL
jgi:hypothetical protein